MILRKDYVQQIQNGLAQVEVEKTEEHGYSCNGSSTNILPIIHASDIILDNTVIKVESEEHGKRVIEWWKEQGVDTIMSGTSIGSYYGIGGEGVVRVIFDDEMHNKKIITLPEPFPSKQENKQENKMRTITWNQGQDIIDIACVDWKGKLFDIWARPIVMKEPIEIKDSFYKQMRKACTKEQHELFDRIFGKEKEDIDLEKETGIGGLKLFSKTGGINTSLIAIRSNGEYCNTSFYLNSNFNWEIKKDGTKDFCLIPTYK